MQGGAFKRFEELGGVGGWFYLWEAEPQGGHVSPPQSQLAVVIRCLAKTRTGLADARIAHKCWRRAIRSS